MATHNEPVNDPPVSPETELLKAELLATLSHELRGPLTAIKGYAATLLRHERRISHEERHEFLLAMVAASDRLEHIVERLLEISQLETDALRIERSPVAVARLAREALTVAEQRAWGQTHTRFTFQLRLGDASGASTRDVPIILADPRRLREVLDQLLENAMNYSPQGGAIAIIVRPVASRLSAGESPDQLNETQASPKDAHTKRAPTVARKAAQPEEARSMCSFLWMSKRKKQVQHLLWVLTLLIEQQAHVGEDSHFL